jgi:hypothetical protein
MNHACKAAYAYSCRFQVTTYVYRNAIGWTWSCKRPAEFTYAYYA